MFHSVRQKNNDNSTQIDIAPLMDVVFILLLFFVVTTTFTKDQGVDITRPESTQSQSLQTEVLRVAVDANGQCYLNGARADENQLTQRNYEPN